MIAAYNVNGLTRLKIVQLVVNAAVILACSIERLNVNDHDVDARIRRETLKMVKLSRIVSKKTNLLSVAFGKVLCSDGQ